MVQYTKLVHNGIVRLPGANKCTRDTAIPAYRYAMGAESDGYRSSVWRFGLTPGSSLMGHTSGSRAQYMGHEYNSFVAVLDSVLNFIKTTLVIYPNFNRR